MTADRAQNVTTMSTRQKVTGIIVLVVVAVVIWQIFGLFSGSKPATTTPAATNQNMSKNNAPGGGVSSPTPHPAQVSDNQGPLTAREQQLMALQKQTQAQYLAAMNDLQVLKVQRDIAEANQAIMSAKLSAVQSEKKIVDLLTPPAPQPTAYSRALVTPQNLVNPLPSPQSTYTVISVSQIQHLWSAVVGNQGNLYSVRIGDVLPDGSKVIGIDKGGITVNTNGVSKRISLIPII